MTARVDAWTRNQAARIADALDRMGDRFHGLAGIARGWAGR